MTDTTQEQSGDRLENVQPDLHSEQPDTLRQYYEQMLLLRRFEERTGEMYTKARIGGYCHLNLGEEATIVGLMAALTPEDYIFTNYREHGYIIARGIPPGPVMAELFGKETGVSRGRGGSMHLFDADVHFMGGYAIVGGQIPLATGAAYALKYQERPGVVVCQMGDATTNIGAWHESLNLAKIYQPPDRLPHHQQRLWHGHHRRGRRGRAGSLQTRLRLPHPWRARGWARCPGGARRDAPTAPARSDGVRTRDPGGGQLPLPRPLGDRLPIATAIQKRSSGAAPKTRLLIFARKLTDAGLVDDAWLKETADACRA